MGLQRRMQCSLQDVQEIGIDVPKAEDLLTLFVARAVTDDILAPAFVKNPLGKLQSLL